MDCTSDQLLAGARLADEQNAGRGWRNQPRTSVDCRHGGTMADHSGQWIIERLHDRRRDHFPY
jgi:hypothetical protein